MKKLLSTIMAVVMLLSLVPMAVAKEGGAEGGAVPSNSVYEVTDAAQLIWAAENHTGDTIKLMKDVEIGETVIVTKTIKLDMNGKTLSNTKNIWNESAGYWSLISVRGNGDLTITGNGKFVAKENDVYAIDLYNDNVRCTIENGTFVGNISAVYVHDGRLIVNGGKFSIQQTDTDNNKPYGFTLNCLDESYADGSAQIIVNGGSFYKYNPAESISENPAAAFSRCGVVQSGDYYDVTAPVAMIGEKGYATLAAAVADVPTGGTKTTITLLRDVNDAHGMAVASGKNFTVDFGGHTYTVTKPGAGSSGTETNAFQLLKDSTVTFKNGTIKCDPDNLNEVRNNKSKVVNVMRIIQDYAALTLEDMVIDGTNLFGDGNLPMSFNNQPVTIKGSTSVILKQGATKAFDADGNWGGYGRCKVTVDTTGTIDGNIVLGQGSLDIKNAKVKGGIVLCTSCGTSETEGQSDRITISGGTFNVAPDAKYLEEGMIVVPNVGKTEYTVQPKTSQEGNTTTTTEVSEDGKTVTETVTETKTDGNTVTKTETNVDTGAATVTKTENKNEGNVATRTETVTVTEKNAAGETTKVTETVTTEKTEKTENGGTTTVVTKKDTLNKTETTEVTDVTAPTTASDVKLDVKNTTNVAVNKASMTALKDDNVKDVIIETKDATLKLNKAAVTTMERNVPTNGKMTLNVTVTENTAKEVTVTVEAKTQGDKNVFPPETKNTNGEIEITIPYTGTADYLDLWYVTNTSTYMGRFPVVNGYVSFKVTHFSQYNLIPVASSGSSVIKTGAGSSAASTTHTVTTDLTPGSITKVTVDGKVVDAKYYTVSGSNVTFTAEFLKTLKNGSHTVTVENATKIAKGVFTVNNPTTAQSPTTADAGIALYAGMAIASVMGTGVVFTSRKRKNH